MEIKTSILAGIGLAVLYVTFWIPSNIKNENVSNDNIIDEEEKHKIVLQREKMYLSSQHHRVMEECPYQIKINLILTNFDIQWRIRKDTDVVLEGGPYNAISNNPNNEPIIYCSTPGWFSFSMEQSNGEFNENGLAGNTIDLFVNEKRIFTETFLGPTDDTDDGGVNDGFNDMYGGGFGGGFGGFRDLTTGMPTFYEREFGICSTHAHCTKDNAACNETSCVFDNFQCKNELLPCSSCLTKKGFTETACDAVGNPKVMVLRVEAQDSSISSSAEELSASVFGTNSVGVSMKSQFESCSYDKFSPSPFTGNTTTNEQLMNGIGEIFLNVNILGLASGSVVEKVLQLGNEKFGDLETQFDFILVCLPPGTLIGDSNNWKAYAYLNSYLSVYNDKNCNYLSVLMHELGHNVGLSHSNDEDNYGDETGYMGLSYDLKDEPLKCFNGAKSWDLQWYHEGHLELDPRASTDQQWTLSLVGFVDYEAKGNKNSLVKITGSADGYEYFISLNVLTGMNADAKEGGTNDRLMVTRQQKTHFDYQDSYLVGRLEEMQPYTIAHYEEGINLIIQMTEYVMEHTPPYANVLVQKTSINCNSDAECDDKNECTLDTCNTICTYTFLGCESCGNSINIVTTTTDYVNELFWNVRKYDSDEVVLTHETYSSGACEECQCLQYGAYIFYVSHPGTVDFSLSVGEETLDSGSLTDSELQTSFVICDNDILCNDYDGCTVDYCNVETKLCENTQQAECLNCAWFSLNITTDNFPEEVAWNLTNLNDETKIFSGDPYSVGSRVHGRRSKPTRAGRRSKPTRVTRKLKKSSTRTLETTENENVIESLCLVNSNLYFFKISDSFGDGICCSEGKGGYDLKVGNITIKTGGSFGSSDEIKFIFSACSETLPCFLDSCSYGTCYEEIQTCTFFPKPCHECGAMVSLDIYVDWVPQDTTWDIRDEGDTKLYSGGPYVEPYKNIHFSECLVYGSYSFNIYDTYGDGMTDCFIPGGACGYILKVDNETVKSGGPGHWTIEIQNFNIPGPLNILSASPSSSLVTGTPSFIYSNIPSNQPSNSPSYYDISNNPSFLSTNIPSIHTSAISVPSLLSSSPSTSPSGFPTLISPLIKKESARPSSVYDDWVIDFEQIIHDYDSHSTYEEILLQYRLSKGKNLPQFHSTILDENCTVTHLNSAVTVGNKSIELEHDHLYDKGIITLNLNKSRFEKSPLWKNISSTESVMSFCVKSELLLDDNINSSVSFSKTRIDLRLNFLSDFSTFNIENINLVEYDPLHVEEESKTFANACICEDTHICIENVVIAQNSKFKVCVFPSKGLQVRNFNNVVLKQKNIAKAIVSDGIVDKLTTVKTGDIGVIETRMVTMFFEEEKLPVTISGEILLGFENNRFLERMDTSSIASEEGVNFEVQITLKQSSLLSGRELILPTLLSLVIFLILGVRRWKSEYKYSLLESNE